jgi:transposase
MANVLKMATVQAIVGLWRQGWSFRRIARELGIHRDTVSRYVAEAGAKPANPTAGAEGEGGAKPAKVTAGISGPRSQCEPFCAVILEKLESGLTAQRIWQDLTEEHGLRAGYESVKRFVRHLRARSPLPFRRMECEPGAEAQVDFGRGAPIWTAEGRRRSPHVFRIVLSHSRKGYSEAVLRQTTDAFIRCLEDAFSHFGGVPRTLVIDNLKAAVSKADWFDPELNPKVEAFCRHYGTVILPTKPYRPRHKGKVERGIGYVQGNALKGHLFASLAEENRHLTQWENRVADHRIHGTTRRQVLQVFQEQEKPALLPLPAGRFPFFHEAQRSVHRDAHMEVEKAYYSAPPEYVGRRVWVRWDARLVRLFTLRMEQIAVHVRREPGRFSTDPAHLAAEKISTVERGAGALLKRAFFIGPHTLRWAEAMLAARGIQGVRVLQGLLSLAGTHTAGAIEQACELALTHGAFRLRELRVLMARPQRQHQIEFVSEHPLIRPVSDYGRIAGVSFRREEHREFTALGDTGGCRKAKEPGRMPPGPPAVYPPASALGSLSSGALSSGPAQETLPAGEPSVNREGGRSA